MKDQRDTGRLSGAERAALLAATREPVVGIHREVAVPSVKRDVSFETLPGYLMIKTQREVADFLGLDEPFYRPHEARAGSYTVMESQRFLNFASYDYLGINGDPRVTEAVANAASTWGTSVSASRLTAGERPFHRELEVALAQVYEMEDCLTYVSGHATNVSTIASLMGPKDLIVHDSLAHNSIVVGAEQSGAHRRVFPHNNLDAVEKILIDQRDNYERCLIVTEGLFSMDGDGPDLAGLIDIKTRWGAWLMVDEAHALGVLGTTGRGIAEHSNIAPSRVDIWMGTLSKTLIGCGGYIAGPRSLIDYLKFNSPGMVYSVGLPAPTAIASHLALTIMLNEPERVAKLQANGRRFFSRARAAGLDVGTSWGFAITPIVVGDSLRTMVLANRLLKRGINAFPIIPPGVPEKSARLRFFLSSAHEAEDLDAAVDAVAEELSQLEAEGVSVSALAGLMK